MAIKNEKALVRAALKLTRLNQLHLKSRRLLDTEDGRTYAAKLAEFTKLDRSRERAVAKIKAYDQKHNSDRVGSWFVTKSKLRFWPEDPRPQDVCLEDIAYALSRLCRYCGHVKGQIYSVAQHSVLVSQVVAPEAALAGLLHDAAEAYLGDVIKPIKRRLPAFDAIEDKVMRAICLHYGLNFDDEALWKEVKRGDNILLATEFRDVARGGVRNGYPEEEAADWQIKRRWSPLASRRLFLERFHELGGDDTWPKSRARKAPSGPTSAAAG